MTVAPGIGSASATTVLPTLQSAIVTPGRAAVSGRIRAPGGPYLYDRFGRVVFFHGVNAVYKYPPFELYPAPGKPWNFSAADASLMARLGFNVVRLGMTWSGLEPGTAPANDPAICGRGTPTNPHQFNQAIFDRYVHACGDGDLLGRFHIYTILDMHQDVYNEMFDGEGAPNWAVCTNGVPSVDPPGRWSLEYATKAAGIAFHHFWNNNVRGDLQGEYDRVWGDVAHAFRGNPWILGYDPFNEPFSTSLIRFGDEHFDAQLECFYTGTANVGTPSHSAPPLRCPAARPRQRRHADHPGQRPVPPDLRRAGQLRQPGLPDLHRADGPAQPRLQHPYLLRGSQPRDRQPDNLAACAFQDARSLGRRSQDRPEMASAAQPGGPGWFVTEFGATSSPALLTSITADLDAAEVGWAYWAWKYYGDPTGSAASRS